MINFFKDFFEDKQYKQSYIETFYMIKFYLKNQKSAKEPCSRMSDIVFRDIRNNTLKYGLKLND